MEDQEDFKYLEEFLSEKPTNYWLWIFVCAGAVFTLFFSVKMIFSTGSMLEVQTLFTVSRPPEWVYTITKIAGVLGLLDTLFLVSILFYSRLGFALHVAVACLMIFVNMKISGNVASGLGPLVHLVVLSLIISKDWPYFEAKANLRKLKKAAKATG